MTIHTPSQLAAGRARGARRNQASTYCIEGESLTTHEIATRLGVTTQATKHRLLKLRNAAGPITWQALGLQR